LRLRGAGEEERGEEDGDEVHGHVSALMLDCLHSRAYAIFAMLLEHTILGKDPSNV
jgi:hypothetical protein